MQQPVAIASLLASVVLVLVALNAGALTLIRLLWPPRVPAWVGSSPWIEDGRHPVSPAVAAPQAGVPDRSAGRPERWRLAGMLAGVIGAVVVLAASVSIRGVLVAAPVFGIGVLAGTLAGELGMPAPTGQVRSAELRVRRTADYIPRWLAALVCASTVALVALVAVRTSSSTDVTARWHPAQVRAGRLTGADDILGRYRVSGPVSCPSPTDPASSLPSSAPR